MSLMKYGTAFALVLLFLLGPYCASEEASNSDTQNKSETGSSEEQLLKKGAKIFKTYCVNCHGMDGKMGFNGAKDLTQTELTMTQRKLLIANGKKTMMAFKNILSPEEISAVGRYSATFAKDNE